MEDKKMKKVYPGRYDYQELLNAVRKDPSQENINALGEWFENYGYDYWNGEEFTIDQKENLNLYRLETIRVDESGDVIDAEIDGYTLDWWKADEYMKAHEIVVKAGQKLEIRFEERKI